MKSIIIQWYSITHLVRDTGGGVAEDALLKLSRHPMSARLHLNTPSRCLARGEGWGMRSEDVRWAGRSSARSGRCRSTLLGSRTRWSGRWVGRRSSGLPRRGRRWHSTAQCRSYRTGNTMSAGSNLAVGGWGGGVCSQSAARGIGLAGVEERRGGGNAEEEGHDGVGELHFG